MKVIDISRVLDENMPAYPGDPAFEKQVIQKHGFVICKLSMSSHAGTHMDAPAHLEGESLTIKDIPLEKITGKCAVCEDHTDIMHAAGEGIRKILLKGEDFDFNAIASLPIELIGIEGLSIGDYDMHQAYLGKNIVVVEGLLLKDVPKGSYILFALPIKTDIDGSPARVVLVDTEGGLL